jgi:hypothetical protein
MLKRIASVALFGGLFLVASGARCLAADTIEVRFTNRTSYNVAFYLNGGQGLETRLNPGESKVYNMVVDPGVAPFIGIHQLNGRPRRDFSLSNYGRYVFRFENGVFVNSFDFP